MLLILVENAQSYQLKIFSVAISLEKKKLKTWLFQRFFLERTNAIGK